MPTNDSSTRSRPAGDAAGFDRLFAEHRLELEGVAYAMTRDRALAEDIVANAAIRVWRRCQEDAPDRPLAYLYRAVQNEARDQLRRTARSRTAYGRWFAAHPEVDRDPDSSIDDRDLLAALLPSLPEKQRRTLELRYLHDLSDPEIARRLGTEIVTVRTNALRALHRLRDLLSTTPEAAHP